MKKITTIITCSLLSFSGSLFSQTETSTYKGYVELGVHQALTSKSNAISGFRGAYNSVFKNKYLIGANVNGGFETNYANRPHPNHINNHLGYYANVGYRNQLSNNLYLTPSIGFGYSQYTLTDFSVGSVKSSTSKYSPVYDDQFIIPVNINVLYTGKYAGVGFNYYFIGGKYTEMGAGLSVVFGKVRDKNPEVIFDIDGDGITDKEDSCPTEKGLVELKGCPDRDGDKIADKEDKCPDEPGLAEFLGCADKDGDKVTDKEDNCPDVAGVVDNKGCPWEDTDKDGILDKDDECPAVAGIKEMKGCPALAPVLKEEEQKIIENAVNSFEFAFGKDVISPSSYPGLNDLAELIKKHTGEWALKLSGHTDNQGDADKNMALSEKRVKEVKKYLEGKGVSSDNIITEWFGQTMPIADNATEEGRQKNRRVEMKIQYKK